jgi:hypothetical protein
VRTFRGIAGHLGAVGLMLLASLPGALQLAHRHAGGERVHVHLDAESLAAHDLLEEYAHPHPHVHPHSADPAHTHVGISEEGPGLRATAAYHVHALNPFQQAARTTVLTDTIVATAAQVSEVPPRIPGRRAWLAARPRGPPALLVG